MIIHLSNHELERHWGALREQLLTGLHPTAGDPIHDRVPVVIFERDDERGEALRARLERARAAAGAAALVVIDYDPAGHEVISPEQGFRLDDAGPSAWRAAGAEYGWTVNGTSFVFSDDTASWVVMTLTDVIVVACQPPLLVPLFGDRDRAEDAYWAFRAAVDSPLTAASYRAMARYARFDI